MAFYSMNAFRLVNAEGAGRFVRFKLDPEAGEHSLPEQMRASADRDYLMHGVLEQLPIRYRLVAQLSEDGDDTADASKPWPPEREWAELGVMEITAKDETREKDGDVLVHDPMRLTDGLEPSDDPILRIRPYVYAISVERRSGGACPAHVR